MQPNWAQVASSVAPPMRLQLNVTATTTKHFPSRLSGPQRATESATKATCLPSERPASVESAQEERERESSWRSESETYSAIISNSIHFSGRYELRATSRPVRRVALPHRRHSASIRLARRVALKVAHDNQRPALFVASCVTLLGPKVGLCSCPLPLAVGSPRGHSERPGAVVA